MKIEVKKPSGARLLTGGKLCPEDIEVTPVLQSKTVTENGTVSPDAGYAGLSAVVVDVLGEAVEAYDGSVTIKEP